MEGLMSTKWTPEMLALKKKDEVQLNPKYQTKAWNPSDFMGWQKQQSEGVQAKPNFVVSPDMFHEQAPLNLRDDVRAIEKNGEREGQSESVIDSMIEHKISQNPYQTPKADSLLNQPWKLNEARADLERTQQDLKSKGMNVYFNNDSDEDLNEYVDMIATKDTDSLRDLYDLNDQQAKVKFEMFRRLMEK